MTNKLKFRVQRDQNQFKIVTKLKKKTCVYIEMLAYAGSFTC